MDLIWKRWLLASRAIELGKVLWKFLILINFVFCLCIIIIIKCIVIYIKSLRHIWWSNLSLLQHFPIETLEELVLLNLRNIKTKRWFISQQEFHELSGITFQILWQI